MAVDLDTPDKPDVADVERQGLASRSSIAALSDASDAFDVVIPASAWDEMQRHARVRLDVEVGGVLVGRPVTSETGKPYLLVEAGIPALAAESRQTNITFTAEAWTHIHQMIDRDHPGAAIVGWYHTHPSFGIFLSEMDLFIQHHFFDLPHQVAIVIDPVANTHGCFIWRSGTPTLGPLLIEGATSSATSIEATTLTHELPPPPPRATAADRVSQATHVTRRTTARIGTQAMRKLLATGEAAIEPFRRLDRAQWFALLSLLALAGALFAALVMLWLDVGVSARGDAAP